MKKLSSFEKYAKFSADFETTFHKNFTDEQIQNADRQTLAVGEDVSEDFIPNKSSKMFLAGLMSLKDYSFKLTYENMIDFFNAIVEMTYKEHHKKALVYFHNLKYDGSYILNWLLQHHWKQTLKIDPKTKLAVINRKQFVLLQSGGKFFNLQIFWRGIKITFLDSAKIFVTSLASLGDELNFKKLSNTVDYSKFEIRKNHKYPKKWITYLKRDCEILAKYLNFFFQTEQKSNSIKRQTIGSIAYSYIRKIVNEMTPNFTINDYLFWQHWYHGGLCFPSFKYWAKWVCKPTKIKMIDKCSMYPSMMVKDLPYGNALTKCPKEKHSCFLHIKIIKATIKKEYDDIAIIWKPFEYQEQKKVLFFTDVNWVYQYLQYIENKEYYIIDKELELWQKLYNIKFKVIKKYYFLVDNYLATIIKELFKDKQTATSKSHRTIAKYRLNNLYGKLGQKPIRQQDYFGDLKDLDTSIYKVVGEKKGQLYKSYNIEKIHKYDEKAQPIFIASYITMLARVNLIEKYLEIKKKGGNFLYCDTDSLIYVDNKNIKWNDLGNNLGCWEYEKFEVADAFCCLCPKQYRLVKGKEIVKLASAGVKKDLMKKVKNQDYNYDLGNNKYKIIKRQLKRSINGNVIFDSPFNFDKWKNIKKNPKCPKEMYN